MNVVLYTRDMEPITVIDIPVHLIERGKCDRIQLPVFYEPTPLFSEWRANQPLSPAAFRNVTLEFHKLILPPEGKVSWIVMTGDEVLALRLRPSWLPGQRSKINDYERVTQDLVFLLIKALSDRCD